MILCVWGVRAILRKYGCVFSKMYKNAHGGQDMGYEDTFRRADQEMYKDKEKFYEENSLMERRK